MSGSTSTPPHVYGLLAQFDQPETLRAAASKAYAQGYRRMEAYSPFPIEDMASVMGHPRSRLPILTLVGGVLGGVTGYVMQYYACVISYPLNVGGRPLNSWPAFIPIIFELTILGAALFTVFGMLGLSGLPMPYHALFNVPEFKRASRDQFFLCIQAADRSFDLLQTREFLNASHALAVYEVPR
jgi:hypothetical protein